MLKGRRERGREREIIGQPINFFSNDSCSHKATPKMYKKP
jgi:hypothetical protein